MEDYNMISRSIKVELMGIISWKKYQSRVIYHKVSSISRTLGNNIVDHSDGVGASPAAAASTTSSLST